MKGIASFFILIFVAVGIIGAVIFLTKNSQLTCRSFRWLCKTSNISDLRSRITPEIKECILQKLGWEEAQRVAEEIRTTGRIDPATRAKIASCFEKAIPPTTEESQDIFEKTTPPTTEESQDITVYKDISFGAHAKQKLDLCKPKKPKGKLPAVLLIHGGGGDKKSYLPTCLRLAEEGFIAATTNWRQEPFPYFDLALSDVKLALEWLVKQEDVDKTKIAAMGGSGGGALSSLLGTLEFENKVKCVVNQFGPTDFTDPNLQEMSFWTDRVFPEAFGVTYQENPKIYEEASPISHVSPNDADFIFTRSVNEKLVPRNQAERMIAALRKVGKNVPDLYEFQGTGPGHATKTTPEEGLRIWKIELEFLKNCLSKASN